MRGIPLCRKDQGKGLIKHKKYTEPVSQETELRGCSIDVNLDSTESGAGGYASRFVKDTSSDGATSDKKLHKSLVIEVSCEASRCAR